MKLREDPRVEKAVKLVRIKSKLKERDKECKDDERRLMEIRAEYEPVEAIDSCRSTSSLSVLP